MSPFLGNSGGSSMTYNIEFPEFDISWVGEGPIPELTGFGSDDGRLLLARMMAGSIEVVQPPQVVADSREAINGVAFLGQHMAVSTRNEVSMYHLARTPGQPSQRVVLPAGAHDVVKTRSGLFVAPLGPTGVLRAKPDDRLHQRLTISRVPERQFYYYRARSLAPIGHPDVLVFATRLGGVTSMVVPDEGQKGRLNWVTFPGFDVVDVCAVSQWGDAPATATFALGKDGTIVFFRDILRDRRPVTIRFSEIVGVAYRIMSVKDHLLVLTSKGLYILGALARRLLAGEQVLDTPTSVRQYGIEAVDAAIIHNRYLLAVTADNAVAFDLDAIERDAFRGSPYEQSLDIRPAGMSPAWETYEYEEEQEPVAA